jgi:hypothetical protein
MDRTSVVAMSAGAVFIGSALVLAQSNPNRLTVPFSDPGRPGTVNVSLFMGGITVRASSGKDVIVTAVDGNIAGREQTSPKGAGLRRLTPPIGISVTEENNVVTISSRRLAGAGDIDVQVPPRTNLKLNTVSGGGILVERVEGDIEVTALNAPVTLTDVAGAAVVHATNGQVKAVLRQVAPDKPMSFTSLNGDVDVTLPPNVKANLKLRTDRGEVLTDFDVQIQQRPASVTRGGAVPPLPPSPPLPPVAPGADPRDADRQARERAAIRERARLLRESKAGNGIDLDSSIYGTVNGGGPEFELRTFNGDVYLRKAK